MRKTLLTVALSLSLLLFSGCFTNVHVVGDGGTGAKEVKERQWYILWGLVPLNELETSEMAGDAENYTIKTEHTFIDGVIGIFTGLVTVYPKTVTVKK